MSEDHRICADCGHEKSEHFSCEIGSFCNLCPQENNVWEHGFSEKKQEMVCADEVRKTGTVPMRVLTMCQGGNSRSVGCGYLLKYKYNMDAIACSWEKNTADTIKMLCEWADAIITMEASFYSYIPEEYRKKLFIVDVGPDRWANSLHPDLIATIEKILDTMIHVTEEPKNGGAGDGNKDGEVPEVREGNSV